MVIEKGKKKIRTGKELTTKAEPRKVDYMVGTFLNEESVKILATKIDRQKGRRYGDYLFAEGGGNWQKIGLYKFQTHLSIFCLT
ncbi:hypothetical protein [Emticicia fontis]